MWAHVLTPVAPFTRTHGQATSIGNSGATRGQRPWSAWICPLPTELLCWWRNWKNEMAQDPHCHVKTGPWGHHFQKSVGFSQPQSCNVRVERRGPSSSVAHSALLSQALFPGLFEGLGICFPLPLTLNSPCKKYSSTSLGRTLYSCKVMWFIYSWCPNRKRPC